VSGRTNPVTLDGWKPLGAGMDVEVLIALVPVLVAAPLTKEMAQRTKVAEKNAFISDAA